MFDFQVGVCVWPILSTINFLFVPERNRVPFISVCSLMWTTFLAYMKQLDSEKKLAAVEELQEQQQQLVVPTSHIKSDLSIQKSLL